MLYIAVDCGRWGIKYAYLKKDGRSSMGGKIEKGLFTNKFGIVDFASMKGKQIITFSEKNDIIAKVDDIKPIVVGDTCDFIIQPDEIISATQDETYLKYSVYYTLIAIARVIENDGEDVILGINLTFNNKENENDLRAKLEGKHTVTFFTPKGSVLRQVNFNVTKVPVTTQGWSTMMYCAMNDKLEFDDSFMRPGIVIDIGRKTVDVDFITKLNSLKGRSYEYAIENVFLKIKDKLSLDPYRESIETHEIETIITEHDGKFIGRNGDEINLKDFLHAAVLVVGEQQLAKIRDDFGGYKPLWSIITGGGLLYFKDIIARMYPAIQVVDDFTYSNSLGILRYMLKYGRA